MQCIHALWSHPLYQKWYSALIDAERDRVYCRHDITHLLDVARIASIMNIEQQAGFSRRVIYAAAVLHDIGKAAQYQDGTPHEIIGADIAHEILQDVCAHEEAPPFTPDDIEAIVCAIREHRRCPEGSSELGVLLYAADKASRACFACAARDTCSWPDERKNMTITI